MKNRRARCHFVVSFMLPLLAFWQVAQPLMGAVVVWDGDTDGQWAIGANWVGNVVPTAGDSLTFTGTTQTGTLNNLTAGTSFAGLVFDNTATGGAFSLGGNAITLGGNITTLGATGTPTHTIQLAMDLSGNRVINTAAGNNLTIGGAMSGSGFGFDKQGAGTLLLSGANSFTGAVTVTAGLLKIQNGSALGTTAGGTTVVSGAELDLSGQTVGAEAVTINGTGIASSGALINSDTVNTARLAGVVTLGSAASVGGDGNLVLTGALAGDFSLTKSGLGTLTLQAAATRAGTAAIITTINSGKIRLENASGMSSGTAHVTVVNTGGTLELASNITHNQPITLNSGGTIQTDGIAVVQGVITVPNAGTPSVTFATTTAASLLTLGNGDNDLTGGIAAAVLNITGPGVVLVAGDGSPTHNVIGTWTVGTGATLRIQRGTDALLGNTANDVTLNGGTFSLLATSDLTANAGRVFTMGTGGGTMEVGTGRIITLGTANQLTGTTSLTKTGGGTLALTAASNFSGMVTINGGTLSLSGNGALAGTTAVTIGNRGVLTLDNTATNLGDRTAGAITSNGGTINFTANAAATTETLGAVALNMGALTITSTTGAGGSTLTIPSITTRNAGTTLLVSGTGVGGAANQVVLGTAPALVNSVLPWAVVSDGTLMSFANYTTSGGTNQSLKPLALTGHVQTVQGATWTNTANVRPIADQTLSANRNAFTLTLDAGIDLLAPAADRNLTFDSASGFGAVLQTGGSSVIGATGANEHRLLFGTNEAIFYIVGDLTIQQSSGTTANIQGTGGLTKAGAGTLTVKTSSVTGTIRLNEGTYVATGGAAGLGGAAALVEFNGGNLTIANDAATTLSPAGGTTVNAATTITVDRLTSGVGLVQSMAGVLSIGNQTLTAAKGALITVDSAYGLTLSSAAGVTLTGAPTFNIDNNGTGVGTLTLGTLSGAFMITKTGTGDLVTNSVTSGFSGPVNIQAGRVGWSNASGTVVEPQIFAGVGGIIKTGAGTVTLTGANTFTGAVNVATGILNFSTVGTNGTVGTPSNLGQGANGITLSGGTLGFVGNASQSTDRAVLLTANGTLSADGLDGATITYSGAFTASTSTDVTLTLTGGSEGFLTSASLVPTRGAGDLTKAGLGTWTVSAGGKVSEDDILVNAGTLNLVGAVKSLDDDIVVTGAGSILNLNTTNVITGNSSTSAGLYARTGAVINYNAENAYGANTGLDFIILGDSGGGTGTLNLNTFNTSTPRLDLGQSLSGYNGVVMGTGALTVSAAINLYQGTVSASLAGGGALLKNFAGTVTLSGDNSGLTGVTAAEVRGGTLVLDYTTSNTTKLRALTGLRMTGGNLVLSGNAGANTLQSVAGLILSAGGGSAITLNPGGAQKIALSVGGILHVLGGSTLRFNLPSGTQDATNGVLTTQSNVNGIIGGYATVFDGMTTGFATNVGGNIVALASTVEDDVTQWTLNQNVTDSAGFTGTLNYENFVSSVRFNAAGPSTVTLSAGGVLDVVSSGILQTSAVTAGNSTITGGLLKSSATSELIFTTDSATRPLLVGSMISGNTAVTKSGTGTLQLSGTNGYAGGTNLNGGMLQVSGGNAVGDNSALTFTAGQSAVFELLSSETIGTLATGGANNTAGAGAQSEIRLNGNTLTLNQAVDGIFTGIFTGTAGSGLVKNGAGVLTLGDLSANFLGTLQINEGQILMSGNVGHFTAISAVVLNGSGSLRNQQANNLGGNRIADSATVLLNNTIFGTGIALANSDDANRNETMGALTLGAGHNVITAESSNTGSIYGALTFASLAAVNNHATALVRGTLLSATTGQRGRIIFTAAPSGGLAAVGGTGTPVTQSAILPYLVGDATGTGLGNSFVRIHSDGLKPLLPTEYIQNAAGYNALTGAVLDNVRFDTSPGGTLGSGPTAINSLVIDAAAGIAVTGAAAGIEITSGAILSAQGVANTLGGYTGITTGAARDYYLYVTDPAGSLTVSSPLTTTAALVKSGAGALILTNAGNAFTDLYLNQGVVQADAMNKLGTGALNFFGGVLKFNGVFDPSTKTITLGTGGGTFDTNGNNITLANAVGNAGAGGLTKTGAGTLTLGAGATNTGATAVQDGRLVVNGGVNNRLANAALMLGSGATSGILQLGDATQGATNQTVTALSTSGSGTANGIVGGGSGVSVLTVNQSIATTYAGALGGAGTNENHLGLVKQGTGSLTLTGPLLSYTGQTTVTAGTLTATTAVSGTTSLSVSGTGSVLALHGGLTTPASISSVTVGNGGTLSLVDGSGNKISNLSALALGGAGNGHISLNLNAGDQVTPGDGLNTDTLSLAAAGALTLFPNNKITFNLTDTGLSASQSYVLLDATAAGGGFLSGGMSLSDYLLGITPSGFTSLTLSNSTNNQIILTTGTLITGNLYWRGLTDDTWNAAPDNWSTDKAGLIPSVSAPGQGTDVVFQWDAPTNAAVTTSLGQNFKINSLTFEASTTPANTPTAVTINSAGSSLEIAPQLPTDGIKITAGGPPVATITVPVKLGANQTWNVVDAGANLTLSGIVSGAGTVTKTGAGTVNLSGANTFNNGLTIKQGSVVATVSGSALGTGTVTLGNTTGSNAASLLVNTTGLTLANPLVLATGTTGMLTIGTPVNAFTITTTFSGGITGNNNVTINNQSLAGATTFSVNPVNNVGSVTNISTSTGTVTISGGVGANVTQVILNSITSAMTVSTTALTVNAGGTTLQNIAGTKILTLSSGTLGTGNLVLKNDSALTSGVTVAGNISHVGTITNNGTGANSVAAVTISGIIDTNVTGVIQDSATSALQLTGANTFTSGVLIRKGILEAATSLSSLGGAGNIITLGDAVGGGDAALRFQSGGAYEPNQINVAAGSGTRSILGSRTSGDPIVQGAIVLANNLSILAGEAAGVTSANITFTGGVTGTGNLIINNGSPGQTGAVTFSTTDLNMTGTITNNATLATGATVISAVIGTNVTGVIQDSLTAALTLSGANTFIGGVTLNTGTLNVNHETALGGTAGLFTINGGILNNSTAAAITLINNNAVTINGDFAFTGTQSLNVGAGNVALGTAAGVARTITVKAGVLTLGGAISNGATANALIKAGSGTLVLSGANAITGGITMNLGTLVLSGMNTFTGGVTLNAGILGINSATALGAATSPLVINAGTIDNSSAGAVTVTNNNPVTINGSFSFAGTQSLNLGAGAVSLTAAATVTTTANTLTVGGVIDDGAGTFALTKAGAGELRLTGVSTYGGATNIDNGTLTIGVTNALPTGNAVRLGTGTTAGTLRLNGFNQTIASLTVQSTTAAVTNNLVIDAGSTLTVNGAVTLGVDADASATKVTASGGGALVVNSGNANFQVGGATGGTNESSVTADFSGLSSFTANLGTGTFRVGDANTGTGANASTFRLATNNSITATSFRVGDGSGGGSVHTLTLGSGTNAINSNTINVGSAGTTIRSSGVMNFDSLDTTGSLTVRGLAGGTSRATINMVNTTGNTGTNISSTINLAGHTADIRAGTMTMASRTQSVNAATATFTFDQGSLDITTLNMASRTTATSTGDATATVNLGDSAAPGVPTVTIGTLGMAVNTSAGGTALAQLNVTGGNVAIGTGSGTAINMANAAAGRTSTANLVLSGGSVSVTGNIIRTGGGGTENATVTLAGAALNMNGKEIGSSAAPIALVAESGMLSNLAQLNGGGDLTKTTAGTLVMAGTSSYTGRTVVTAGKLSISSETNIGANPGVLTADQILLNGGTLLTTANLLIDDSNRGITVGAAGGTIETDAGTTATVANVIAGGGTLTKEGAGTLLFTGVNTNTGVTNVNAGILGGTGVVGGDANVASGGSLAPGTTAQGLLTIGGNLTVSSGGTLLMELGGNTANDADAVFSYYNANGNLTGMTVKPGYETYVLNATAHDHLVVNGSAAPVVNGTVKISAFLGGYNPAYGDIFDLMDWSFAGNLGGTPMFDFSGVSLAPGLGFNTDLFASNGLIVVVPEPSRMLLVLLGLLGVLGRRRRVGR